ncbi:MAG: 3',5'-cyclic-nucleotide phosphodiesterase [Gammaproteobacteria bacterium]|nr:3',5'-cyclic-nucleotide phosphodiesterase [Gammaproteobacteria bacterium]MDH5651387.1 3',5'-cyclic-nucleotide phosphodiesterase [Gammaproteobacteria bacterium]
MELRVLGCSGGIGTHLRTTSLLINNDILIDAGTGLGDLSLDEMETIRHVFLTHSHLDHLTGLPLMIDSIFDRITTPVTLHAQPLTMQAVQKHIFNNVIWPDFSTLPSRAKPVLRYEVMEPGSICKIGDVSFESIPVNHVVPAIGYCVSSPTGTFAFSGDSSTNDTFWNGLNKQPRLDVLIVETAFTNEDHPLSQQAGHYCPRTLGEDLKKLKHEPKIYLSHHKPGAETIIFAECRESIPDRELESLRSGQRIQL